MTLINRLWGATIGTIGGSYLFGKPFINIKEGFQRGNTFEYVDLGDFEVANFQNNGVLNQSLTLELTSQTENVKSNDLMFPRGFQQMAFFYDNFIDSDSLNQHYTQYDDGYSITSGLLKYDRAASSADINQISFDTIPEIESCRVILKGRCNRFDTSESDHISMLFCIDDWTLSSGTNGYSFQLRGEPDNDFRLIKLDTGAVTVLDSTSFNPTNNTWYWLMVVKDGVYIKCYSSTDGIDYTLRCSATDSSYKTGGVGIRSRGGNSATECDYEFIDVVEIGNFFTDGDIIDKSLALAGIFDVKQENEVEGFTDFVASTGSCWITGETNGYQYANLLNTSGASSFAQFFITGRTFVNFCLECEMKIGSSGNWAGLFVGTTTSYVGNNYTGDNNRVEEIVNSVHNSYANRGDYFNFQLDRWYRLKLVKSNLFIGWYVNDFLVNSFYGVSLPGINSSNPGSSNSFGLFSQIYGSSGTYTNFRKLRVRRFDNPIDTARIDTSNVFSTLLDNYLGDGAVMNQHGSQVEVFTIGASRGINGVTNYIENSSETIDNNAGVRGTFVQGENAVGAEMSIASRQFDRVDFMRMSYIEDLTAKSKTDSTSKAHMQLFYQNQDVKVVDISIKARPQLELYDRVGFVDRTLGISRAMYISGFDKSYDAENGSFKQNLTLVDLE